MILRALGALALGAAVAVPGVAARQILSLPYEEGDWVSLSDFRWVRSLDVDYRIVYVGTTNGVERYNRLFERWEAPLTTSDGLPGEDVLAVAVDPQTGLVWFGTSEGVGVYDPDLRRWSQYRPEDGLPGREVDAIVVGIEERAGEVYVRASGSWARIRPGAELIDPAGEGDLPPKGKRILRGPFDPQLLETPRYAFLGRVAGPDAHLRTFPITALVEDDRGVLWIGTWGGNLQRVSLLNRQFEPLDFGLLERWVRALAVEDGGLWCGGGESVIAGRSGGVTRLSRDLLRWTYFESPFASGLSQGEARALLVAEEAIWVGTDRGLSRWDRQRQTWKTLRGPQGLPSEFVLSLASWGGRVWVGTRSGLVAVDPDSLVVTGPALIGDFAEVAALATSPRGLWVGSSRGLALLPPGTEQAVPLWEGEGMQGAGVTALAAWGDEVLVGTEVGLRVYDAAEGTWAEGYERADLQGRRVYSVAGDSANLWVGLPESVMRQERATGTWTTYRAGNFGLLAVPAQVVLPDGDHVWFGTPRGLTCFYWNDPSRAR